LQNQRPSLEFKIEWVPGHMDIAGNEKADAEAKRAAFGNAYRRNPPESQAEISPGHKK